MDMPPSRYKVVEQGRRLVVLDSWNGDAPVAGHAPPAAPPVGSARPATVEQARAALRRPEADRSRASMPSDAPVADIEAGVVVTQSWFDDKAPRRVRMRQDKLGTVAVAAVAAMVLAMLLIAWFGWPVLIVAGVLASQKGSRRIWRGWTTGWLNGMEQLD